MAKLVIINGEEEFLKERAALDEVDGYLSDNIAKFNFPDDVDGFNEFIELNYSSEKKQAIIINNVTKIPQLPACDCLVICIAPASKKLSHPSTYRFYDFPKLKAYDNRNEVLNWIINEGRRLNIDLNNVANALFVSCGKSLHKLSSEIRKLQCITLPGELVSLATLKSVVSFSSETTPQTVIDSISKGQTAKALLLFDRIMEQNDMNWFVTSLQNFISQQISIWYASHNNIPSKDTAKFLKLHPFIVSKLFEEKLGLWSLRSLIDSYQLLFNVDRAIRLSDESVKLTLEQEIVRLSEEAKKKYDKSAIDR